MRFNKRRQRRALAAEAVERAGWRARLVRPHSRRLAVAVLDVWPKGQSIVVKPKQLAGAAVAAVAAPPLMPAWLWGMIARLIVAALVELWGEYKRGKSAFIFPSARES